MTPVSDSSALLVGTLPRKPILQGTTDGVSHVRNTEDEGNISLPSLASAEPLRAPGIAQH